MRNYLLSAILLFATNSSAQLNNAIKTGGGEYVFNSTNCVSPQQREAIVQMLNSNIKRLKAEGRLSEINNRETAVLFDWPLRQANGSSDPGYYGISNFVDHNVNYPNLLQDYNCGTRTYDLSSGYNHQGTDIFLWPFAQLKQANNWVEIIAAEAGTIIGKSDGNDDHSCAFCSAACDWNAVFIQHADGSVAWYGHMKKNSPTSKTVGQTVAKGEYLGVVGSSGNSTGPHLHFEVYKSTTFDLTNRIDPFAGTCNSLNGNTSWWAAQKPYRESMVNKLSTNAAQVNFGSCPALEVTNEKTVFNPGELVYFYAFFRDQTAGSVSTHTIYKPDASVYTTWNINSPQTYNASFWWNSYTLPSNAPGGTWKFEVVYNGVTNYINFSVNFPTAVNDIINEKEIKLYPNPAAGKLYFTSFKTFKGVKVVIENLIGQKLLVENKNNFRGGMEFISLNSISRGLYTISVFEENKLVYRNKFIKE